MDRVATAPSGLGLLARRGKPVAALISTEDLALLQKLEDAEDVRAATEVLREYDRNVKR